jgi:galactosylceramidase
VPWSGGSRNPLPGSPTPSPQSPTPNPPSGPTAYQVEIAATGGIFDGIGAISGGGGETVLLPAYPAKQQSEILDYLFRPSFGAALHILKLEIGGDAISTDGAEPSHMHTEEEPPNFDRGYEWWMAKQAKQRNPPVKLYGLPWEWPKWVGAGTTDPYTDIAKPIKYVLEWMKGASSAHDLSIDFLGIWNECACDPAYVIALRKALDEGGFNGTMLVAPDGSSKTANAFIQAMEQNPQLAAATYAVGYHYPNSDPGISSTVQAKIGKPLWASEDDSTVDPAASAPATERPRKQPGGGCLVRTINEVSGL